MENTNRFVASHAQLIEALKAVESAEEQLENTTIELDDGRDSGDFGQNNSFCCSYYNLKKIRKSLASIDFLESSDQDELWKQCNNNRNIDLPEDLYSSIVSIIEGYKKCINDLIKKYEV